jgi:hypothetical protein
MYTSIRWKGHRAGSPSRNHSEIILRSRELQEADIVQMLHERQAAGAVHGTSQARRTVSRSITSTSIRNGAERAPCAVRTRSVKDSINRRESLFFASFSRAAPSPFCSDGLTRLDLRNRAAMTCASTEMHKLTGRRVLISRTDIFQGRQYLGRVGTFLKYFRMCVMPILDHRHIAP